MQARQLRAGQVERGEGGDEREQPGRDPARALEDVEQRVVLEPREDELDHLPERLLDIAGVGAEEADQRGVGQRREDEADHEHDRERPDPDDPGGDDRGRLPQLPELADELGLGGRTGPGGGGFRLGLRLGARGRGLGGLFARGRRRRLGGRFHRRGRGLRRGWGGRFGLCRRRPGARCAAVRAEARAVLQPLAALVAERHPGREPSRTVGGSAQWPGVRSATPNLKARPIGDETEWCAGRPRKASRSMGVRGVVGDRAGLGLPGSGRRADRSRLRHDGQQRDPAHRQADHAERQLLRRRRRHRHADPLHPGARHAERVRPQRADRLLRRDLHALRHLHGPCPCAPPAARRAP